MKLTVKMTGRLNQKMHGSTRNTKAVVASASVVALVLTAGLRGWSQERDNNRLLREAIVSPTTAYVALPPDFICADGDNEIFPSPDGKDVLVQHTVTSTPRSAATLMQDPEEQQRKQFEAGEQVNIQLLLYSQGDDHPQIVWRGGGSRVSGLKVPSILHWLPGTRTLLANINSLSGPLPKNYFDPERSFEEQKKDPLQPTLSFVLINGVTGKSQTIASNLPPTTRMLPSFTSPVVVFVDSESGTLQRMERGKLGPLFQVQKTQNRQDRVFWRQLLPDDRTLDGIGSEAGEDGAPRRSVSYRFDTVTGSLSRLDTPVFTPFAKAPVMQMPLVVRREKGTLTRDGVSKEVYPLWLEGRDKDTVGRILIAPDSDVEQELVVLETAVLYRCKGAVYAVPILKSSASEFLAQRREKYKRETLDRARQIAAGMKMYADDYDGNLPPANGKLAETVTPYLDNPGVFENPATGQSGFTVLYRGTLLSAMEPAATTRLGSLGGPGGVAVLYADGHVQWQDDPSSKP